MSQSGTTKSTFSYWTVEEDNVLLEAIRNGLGMKEAAALFPERSYEAARKRYRKMKQAVDPQTVKPNAQSGATEGGFIWGPEDDKVISEGIRNALSLDDIHAMLPGRTREGVRHRVKHIKSTSQSIEAKSQPMKAKIPSPVAKRGDPWSAQDDEAIIEAIRNGLDIDQIHAMFPGRTRDAIRHRFNKNFDKHSVSQQKATPQLASLTSQKANSHWPKEDVEKLTQAIRDDLHVDLDQMTAWFPNRSKQSVQNKASRIRVTLKKANELASSPRKTQQEREIRPAELISQGTSFNPEDTQTSSHSALQSTPRPTIEPFSPPRPLNSTETVQPAEEAYEPSEDAVAVFEPHHAPGNDREQDIVMAGADYSLDPTLPPMGLIGTPYSDLGISMQEEYNAALQHGNTLQIPQHDYYSTRFTDDPDRMDTGLNNLGMSAAVYPELRNGFNWTPVPHHPVTPPGFETSLELFSDPAFGFYLTEPTVPDYIMEE